MIQRPVRADDVCIWAMMEVYSIVIQRTRESKLFQHKLNFAQTSKGPRGSREERKEEAEGATWTKMGSLVLGQLTAMRLDS